MRYFLSCLLVVLYLTSSAQQEAMDSATRPDSLSSVQCAIDSLQPMGADAWYFAAIAQDHVSVWTSPARWAKKDWLVFSSVAVSTSLALLFDEGIYLGFKNYQAQHQWVSDLSPKITYGGENSVVLGASAAFFLAGVVAKNPRAQQTGLLAIEALAHSAIVTRVGKLSFGRQRPSYQQGTDQWHWAGASVRHISSGPASKYDAFPSGHTTAAFALATVIAEQYRHVKFIPPLMYTLASGVAFSRITEDTHWLSDVILGGAIGYACAKLTVNRRKDTKFRLLPRRRNKI